jgi:photosystem II stability/assembly factor-like uncharacterized protein
MFIATSTDGGATWKDHSLMTTSDRLQAVLWNGNQFVSVGSHGRVMTSPDGETWTAGHPARRRSSAASPGMAISSSLSAIPRS